MLKNYKQKLFAELVSYMFHPVNFVLTMPFLIVYRQTASSSYALKWTIFSSIFIGLGLFFIILGRFRGFFSDLDISKREERPKFYLIVWILAFIYMGLAFVLKGIFFPLSVISFGIVLGIICVEVLNNFTKVSIHLTVAAAWVVSIGILFGIVPFLFVFPVLPLVAWSRISLKAHTRFEVIIGCVAGSIITVGTFFVGRLLYA